MRPPPADVLPHYVTAVGHVQAGRFRESADAYLTAFLMPSCAHTEGWWHVWRGFTSIISDNHFPASENHLRVLKRVARDESVPLVIRAEAQCTRGVARYATGNREAAARDYTATLALVSRATTTERAARVWDSGLQHNGQMGLVQKVVGDVLDQLSEDARRNLDRMRGVLHPDASSSPGPTAAALRRAGATVSGGVDIVRKHGGAVGPIGDRAENEAALADAMSRLAVGGDRCDRCGQLATEDAPLKRCSRCQLAFYCSQTCARQAWKAGHKTACRAPGQFELGDKAQVQGLVSRPELNGEILEIRGPAPGGTGRIATAAIGGEVEVSLKPANLRRLRPTA